MVLKFVVSLYGKDVTQKGKTFETKKIPYKVIGSYMNPVLP